MLQSPTNLLSPTLLVGNPIRRRSSVMFSDIVLLHGDTANNLQNSSAMPATATNMLGPNTESLDKRNVCSSEKMTQTGTKTRFITNITFTFFTR